MEDPGLAAGHSRESGETVKMKWQRGEEGMWQHPFFSDNLQEIYARKAWFKSWKKMY